MTDRLHQIRQKNPELRLAIYAMTPGEPVTLEILTPDDQVFTFTKPTLTEALDEAFPPEPEERPPMVVASSGSCVKLLRRPKAPAPVEPERDPIMELFGEEWP